MATPVRDRPHERARLTGPGILLGIGLGGFVDGIVLHQLLQWHHMLSSAYPPTSLANTRVNITADGFFHTFVWIAVVAGVLLLWRAVRHGRPCTWRSLSGWILAGWGVFNLVEGIVDHHILQVHRVRADAAAPMIWDVGFLVVGALLLAGGWALARTDRLPTSSDAAQR